VIIGGVFYTLASAVEVLGFGTSAPGLAAFHASGSLFGTLGSQYVASWLGDVVTVGTIVSAYGGALASIVGGARLWYSLTNAAVDRPTPVTRVSARWGTPVGAVLLAGLVSCVVTVIFAWVIRFAVLNTFAWLGTVATLLMLFIYIMVTVGAGRLLFFSVRRSVRRWEIVIPAAGVLVLGYTIYRNIVPYPTGPFFWLPIASGAWILVALGAVVLVPRLSRRIAAALASDVDLNPREDEAGEAALPG
jgi:amino acid transporter